MGYRFDATQVLAAINAQAPDVRHAFWRLAEGLEEDPRSEAIPAFPVVDNTLPEETWTAPFDEYWLVYAIHDDHNPPAIQCLFFD